jgi:hypothetical protein
MLKKITARVALLLCCVAMLMPLRAADLLSHRIDVSFYQTPLPEALREVAQKGKFEWSYNSNILDANKNVTLSAQSATVREVLLQILGGEYTFKQSGEYLILKRRNKTEKKISGYLSDQQTGKKVPNATIYDKETLKSTVTDQDGYYELPVGKRSELVVSKLTYRDTVLQVSSQTPRFMKIELKPDTTPPVPPDPWESIKQDLSKVPSELAEFFNLGAQKMNEVNIGKDSLHRIFQISFLPNIGTNHRLSGSVTNNVSLNILAGYARGVDGTELGGVGNLTREDVHGVQVGGVFNYVGRNAEGVQVGGVFNHVRGNVKGVQVAGVYNSTGRKAEAIQVGGFGNWADSISGIQVAGFGNYGGTGKAIQVAGFMNLAKSGVMPVQVAGFLNQQRGGRSIVQVSGFINQHTKGVNNTQIAGFINIADTVQGVQVSGFINKARFLKGVQVGIINRADSIDGVQIGLINSVRKNRYMVLDVAANEVHKANLSFKSGSNALYFILTAGLSPDKLPNGDYRWSSGWGLGTRFWPQKRLSLTLDAVHRHVNEGFSDFDLAEWVQLAPALNLRFGPLSLAAGPSANLFISEEADLTNNLLPARFEKYSNSNGKRLLWWPGAQLSLRVHI